MKARIIAVPSESHNYQDFWYVDYKNERLKICVGDWAPNLLGELYEDPEIAMALDLRKDTKLNGGVIGAVIARDVIMASDEYGESLIKLINQALSLKYQQYGIENYENNRALTFTGYIAHAIVRPDKTFVTGVGDVKLAMDQKIITGKTKLIDIYNSNLRKKYIEETGDIKGGFEHVKPNIIAQYDFQNTVGQKFSYAAIDGTNTLSEGVDVINLPTPKHLLIWSDGYLDPDGDFTIEGLERKLEQVYKKDPYRCKEYPAVGFHKGDRTAIEILLDKWNALEIELLQQES